jgi:hypothetical protein
MASSPILLSKIQNIYGEISFFIKKLFWLFPLPVHSMSGSDLTNKLRELSKGKNVIEFGAGGSTILFSTSAKAVYSVESDRMYVARLRKYFRKHDLTNVRVEYANIGPTKSLGFPIALLRVFFKKRYPNYSSKPFKNSKILDGEILVFVDGRFRVCCALQSAEHLAFPFTLVFDDYFNRSEYRLVEKFFGVPVERIGNAAIFEISKLNKGNDFYLEISINSKNPN